MSSEQNSDQGSFGERSERRIAVVLERNLEGIKDEKKRGNSGKV